MIYRNKNYKELDIDKFCEFKFLTKSQIELKRLMEEVPTYNK